MQVFQRVQHLAQCVLQPLQEERDARGPAVTPLSPCPDRAAASQSPEAVPEAVSGPPTGRPVSQGNAPGPDPTLLSPHQTWGPGAPALHPPVARGPCGQQRE